MGRSRDREYNITWVDIAEWEYGCLRPLGLTFTWRIVRQHNLVSGAYQEVTLHPLGTAASDRQAYTHRAACDPRNPMRLYPQLLRVLVEALAAYEAEPWLWSPERRRAARGE